MYFDLFIELCGRLIHGNGMLFIDDCLLDIEIAQYLGIFGGGVAEDHYRDGDAAFSHGNGFGERSNRKHICSAFLQVQTAFHRTVTVCIRLENTDYLPADSLTRIFEIMLERRKVDLSP